MRETNPRSAIREFKDPRFPNLKFMAEGMGQDVYEILDTNQVLKLIKHPPLLVQLEDSGLPVSFVEFCTKILQAVEKTGKVRFPKKWQALGDLNYNSDRTGGFTQTKYDGIQEGARTLAGLPLMDDFSGANDTRVFFYNYKVTDKRPIFLDWDTFIERASFKLKSNNEYPSTKEEFNSAISTLEAEIKEWGK